MWVRRRSGQKMFAQWWHSRTLVSHETTAEEERERNNLYYYIVCYMQPHANLQWKLCGALGLYMIQSLHGKRLFNNLPHEWKCPVMYPTMLCALFNPSSIRGAYLSPPALLLLALAPDMSQCWPWDQPCHQNVSCLTWTLHLLSP